MRHPAHSKDDDDMTNETRTKSPHATALRAFPAASAEIGPTRGRDGSRKFLPDETVQALKAAADAGLVEKMEYGDLRTDTWWKLSPTGKSAWREADAG